MKNNKVVFFGKVSQKWVAYLEYQGMETPWKRFGTKQEAIAYLNSK